MANETIDLSSTEVLIVDDIPSARKILTRILNKLGCKNVIECDNAKQVLVALETNPEINLIISDREMPDMSGIDLLKVMREKNEFKDLNFILISSSVSREDIAKIGELGPAEILLKPFSSKSLSQKLHTFSQAHEDSPE